MTAYRICAYNGYIPRGKQKHFEGVFEAATAADAVRAFKAADPFSGNHGPNGLRIRQMCVVGTWADVPATELVGVVNTYKAMNGEDVLVHDGRVL